MNGRRWMGLWGALALAVVALGSCGTKALTPGPGLGGSAGGGVGGVGGGGVGGHDAGPGGRDGGNLVDASAAGSGGQSYGPLQLPSCLVALLTQCPANGACVPCPADGGTAQDAGADGSAPPPDVCYRSGVRVSYMGLVPTGGTASGTLTTQVEKPNGDLCYALKTFSWYGGESVEYTWTDATGNTVVTADFGNDAFTFQCAATAERASEACAVGGCLPPTPNFHAGSCLSPRAGDGGTDASSDAR
jgi:hypothetical protein